MPRQPYSVDITGQMVILGTGTSVGVPAIGCGCPVCTSTNPKNQRTRCSIVVGLPEGNLLIDTSPEMRMQLVRERIGLIHAVFFTHEHSDHVMGLDDLRLMQFYLNGPVPIYCEKPVEARIKKAFDYAFEPPRSSHVGAIPKLELHPLSTDPIRVLGEVIQPIRLQHGPSFQVLGFRFGNIAYCTDVNAIPPESMERLRGLDVLILGALRHEPHTTHFSVGEAIEIAKELKPKQTYLTHLSHELEQEATNAALPPGVALAYDGMKIPLS